MSNGYLVAASADAATAHEIGDGFGLDVIEADTIGDVETVGGALAQAANVGLLLSSAAADEPAFVALLQALAPRLSRAQIILVDSEAREKFAFLPTMWPSMSLADARTRAQALAQQRNPAEAPPVTDPPPEAPEPEAPIRERPVEAEPAPEHDAAAEAPPEPEPPTEQPGAADEPVFADEPAAPSDERAITHDADADQNVDDGLLGGAQEREENFSAEAPTAADEIAPEPAAPPAEEAPPAPPQAVEPPVAAAPPQVTPPEAPPMQAPSPQAPETVRDAEPPRKRSEPVSAAPPSRSAAPTAPADATAFAPKKLRRETPELVRIVVHQPKDLQAVIKAAKKIDPRSDPAPQGMAIGDVAIGAKIGVSLEVRGAVCDGAIQRRTWTGEPIDFSYSVEAEAAVKQVVFLARVFVDDAQIGVLAFTRNVSGAAKKPHSEGDRVRLKRHKRVFLSYSSKDRETVAAIATAYQSAGVDHFWDRASLKSGEEWHPRLRREIDRADLFHVCWSRAAAESEWVKKETEHALTRRRKNSGRPEITVQMLDGPPWAPHPPELDAINFDDFVRAAIVGYARGDGSA